MNAFDYAENASGRTCSDQHSAFGAIRFNQCGIHRMSLAHTTILGGKTKRHNKFDAEISFLDFSYSRTASSEAPRFDFAPNARPMTLDPAG
jgi:hypothetical protein